MEQAASIVLHHRQDELQAQLRRMQRQVEKVEDALAEANKLSAQVSQELKELRGELGG